jgi:hypothetical protein
MEFINLEKDKKPSNTIPMTPTRNLIPLSQDLNLISDGVLQRRRVGVQPIYL